MSFTKRKIVTSAITVLTGNAATQAMTLGTSILVARALPREEFGIAAAFFIVTTMLFMMSELGLEQFLVQNKEGDSDRVGRTVQSVLLARGVLIGLVVAVLAQPMAAMLDIREVAWGFYVLAFEQPLRGLINRDLIRMQRQMRFVPQLACRALPELAALIAAWPLAKHFGDFRVFLVLPFIRTGLTAVASQFLAERRMTFGWDKKVVMDILHFGWPLTLNGLLIYGVTQSDKAIVGTMFEDKEVLAGFTVAASMTLMPALFWISSLNNVFLPVFSKVRDEAERFKRQVKVVAGLQTGVAGVAACAGVTLGVPLIAGLYGSKYHDSGLLVAWLGMMQAVRLLRATPSLACISKGDTKGPLLPSLVRNVAVPLGIVFVMMDMGVKWVAIGGVIGEVVAMGTVTLVMRSRHRFEVWDFLGPFAIACPVVGLSMVAMEQLTSAGHQSIWVRLGVWVMASAILIAALVLASRPVREHVTGYLSDRGLRWFGVGAAKRL